MKRLLFVFSFFVAGVVAYQGIQKWVYNGVSKAVKGAFQP